MQMIKFLGEDETGSGDILLDGTDSSSTDAGDNIINEGKQLTLVKRMS